MYIIFSVCHMTWCRLTNIVTDVGRGVGEDPVDELTNDFLVHNEMSLEEKYKTHTSFICVIQHSERKSGLS